jgi:acetylornithine deacetylase/succinyl-diaminopimelate desuccinylase-like protein
MDGLTGALAHWMSHTVIDTQILTYAKTNRSRFVSELAEFVRFPSVSAQPMHAADVRRCAIWLAHHLAQVGLTPVRIIRTRGHPLVYADWRRQPGRPVVLIYGHYASQRTEPPESEERCPWIR